MLKEWKESNPKAIIPEDIKEEEVSKIWDNKIFRTTYFVTSGILYAIEQKYHSAFSIILLIASKFLQNEKQTLHRSEK